MRFNFSRFFRTITFVGIVLYFSFKLIFSFFGNDPLTENAVYGQLNIEKNYSGFIFRNELIINTNVKGNVRYAVSDGEKIKKGLKVLEIYFDSKGKKPQDESSEEKKETVVAQSLTISEADLDGEINKLVIALLEAREQKDFLRIKDLKQDLDLKIDKKKMLKGSLSASAQGFEQTFVGQGTLAEGQSISFYSPKAGIVAFSSDGMESVLTLENIYKLDYESLLNENIEVKPLSTDFVSAGQPVYKIVDNSLWMLVALIEKEEIGLYEEGQYVRAEIQGQASNGVVSKVFETGNRGALVLKMTEQIPDFQKTRLTQVKIVRENYQGLKVPNSAVVLRGNVQGVYVLGVDGRAVFKPVQVIGYDDERAVVKDGYVEVTVDEKPKRVRSIQANDEVLIEGSKYKEGDIVN